MSEYKGLAPTDDDIEWAKVTFEGKLTNDRSLPRLDSRWIDPDTGEVYHCADLENLGKAGTILANARQKVGARCGVRKITPTEAQPAMLTITTPCPDGQVSRHVVVLNTHANWEPFGCVPRPGGQNGGVRVELVKCQYARWAEGTEPKWRDPENKRGFLNAAAYNAWRQSRGWKPMKYKDYAEKHLLTAVLKEKPDQRFCVPCDQNGEPFDWVWERIAKGRRIELTSWDEQFQPFEAEAVAA